MISKSRSAPVSCRPRILLVGATGQVGRELVGVLDGFGDLTTTVHRLDVGGPPSARVLDLIDLRDISRCVKDVAPTLIVNAAAYTNVDSAESDSTTATVVNALAPAALAQAAARRRAAMIHFSTDYVFDGRRRGAWLEDDLAEPVNTYGRTKLAGERLVRDSGAAFLILRTSWVYSAVGRNFLTTMLRFAETRDELRVVHNQIGAPTSARFLAQVLERILTFGACDWHAYLRQQGGVVHATCAGQTSWYRFAKEIVTQGRRLEWPIQVKRIVPISAADYPAAARRPQNSVLSLRRLRDRFGIDPPHWRRELIDVLNERARYNALRSTA